MEKEIEKLKKELLELKKENLRLHDLINKLELDLNRKKRDYASVLLDSKKLRAKVEFFEENSPPITWPDLLFDMRKTILDLKTKLVDAECGKSNIVSINLLHCNAGLLLRDFIDFVVAEKGTKIGVGDFYICKFLKEVDLSKYE